MLKLRVEMLAAVLLLFFSSLAVVECGAQKKSKAGGAQRGGKTTNRPQGKATPSPTLADEPLETPVRGGEGTVSDEVKVLAEGQYGNVEESFVAVVRDAETYRALRSTAGSNLPELNEDFFNANAVVAAYLGTRRSGGYGVRITRAGDGALSIAETTPPKDAMTTMALTAPFKIVSVGLNQQRSLAVTTEGQWRTAMQRFRVSTGEFGVSGGITGRMQKFPLEGELHTARLGQLVTIAFSLRSAGAGGRERALNSLATGTTSTDGQITLPRFDPGSLMSWPHGDLRANGRFQAGEARLSLSFGSLPIPRHSESFSGSGQLEAQAVK